MKHILLLTLAVSPLFLLAQQASSYRTLDTEAAILTPKKSLLIQSGGSIHTRYQNSSFGYSNRKYFSIQDIQLRYGITDWLEVSAQTGVGISTYESGDFSHGEYYYYEYTSPVQMNELELQIKGQLLNSKKINLSVFAGANFPTRFDVPSYQLKYTDYTFGAAFSYQANKSIRVGCNIGHTYFGPGFNRFDGIMKLSTFSIFDVNDKFTIAAELNASYEPIWEIADFNGNFTYRNAFIYKITNKIAVDAGLGIGLIDDRFMSYQLGFSWLLGGKPVIDKLE